MKIVSFFLFFLVLNIGCTDPDWDDELIISSKEFYSHEMRKSCGTDEYHVVCSQMGIWNGTNTSLISLYTIEIKDFDDYQDDFKKNKIPSDPIQKLENQKCPIDESSITFDQDYRYHGYYLIIIDAMNFGEVKVDVNYNCKNPFPQWGIVLVVLISALIIIICLCWISLCVVGMCLFVCFLFRRVVHFTTKISKGLVEEDGTTGGEEDKEDYDSEEKPILEKSIMERKIAASQSRRKNSVFKSVAPSHDDENSGRGVAVYFYGDGPENVNVGSGVYSVNQRKGDI